MPTEVITALKSNHKAFTKHITHPYYVFDGRDHPMKADTITYWVEEINKARNELFQFYYRGKDHNDILTDNDFTVAMRNIKKINRRSNELINLVKNWIVDNKTQHMCAPFEVKWKCVHLEQMNIVHGVMSIDDDCIVLGARKLYFKINFKTETFQFYDKITDALNGDKNLLFVCESRKWPLIVSFLGKDCITRVPNVGYAMFNKVLPKLVTWDAENVMNAHNNNLRHKIFQDHMILLKKSINLFRHAPVLSEYNRLKPINKMGVCNKSWGEKIGVSVDPNNILLVKKNAS